MNIAHCIHGLGLGGAQQIVRLIVAGGDQDRHRYFVYSSLGGVRRDDVVRAGATVRVIPRHLPKFDPFWAGRLARTLRQDGISLVHTHLFGDSLHGVLAARLAGNLPVIMTVHTEFARFNPLQRLAYRWLVPRCARTVACSETVRDSFVSAGVRGSEDIVAIANGIELPASLRSSETTREEFRRRHGIGKHCLVLATVGRLVEAKGYRYVISAFARLCSSVDVDLRLVLFGDGRLKKSLERLAQREGVGDRVVFTGYRADVNELLTLVDVVVFSSIWEGLPVALLEAMAAKRCIVGTEIPGLQQAVRGEREAILVPPGSVEGLYGGLRRAVTDAPLRATLGRAARARFDERFTAVRMVAEYEALYEQIMQGGWIDTARER